MKNSRSARNAAWQAGTRAELNLVDRRHHRRRCWGAFLRCWRRPAPMLVGGGGGSSNNRRRHA